MALIKNKYFMLFTGLFMYSFSGVLSKTAAMSGFGFMFFVYVGLMICLLAINAIIWQQVLKKFSLVTAVAWRGSVVIMSLVWAAVFFREEINLLHIIGAAVIVAGIYIVATGEAEA